ncbi:ABC transporter ATP-binding protein [Candidatus Peregrinibacteria bacterium]|nr:ABC transporter ATP-binding protein [Candidatus Peregrinibacteria bacterium]
MNKPGNKPPQVSVFAVLKPYAPWVVGLIVLAFLSNALNLVVPKLIADGIDSISKETLQYESFVWTFWIVVVGIFVLSYIQGFLQGYVSELVARDLRTRVVAKISQQSFVFVQKTTASKLLTNLTSDIQAIKTFVAQAIISIVSAIFILIGASILLLTLNWKLGLIVLTMIPVIGATYMLVFSKVRVLFMKTQVVIDKLNKVINESILGSALIRVLNSQQHEYEKFFEVNGEAKTLGLGILKLFASLIPIVVFVSNLSVLAILAIGGYFVINSQMTLGEFAAFNSYAVMLIFPILIIGFMSNVIARATVSYTRIHEVLTAPELKSSGELVQPLKGELTVKGINLEYGEKKVLKDLSFQIKPGTRTAIVGPTAAGKTQLLYLLTGLIEPNRGEIKFDGHNLSEYDSESFYKQIGIVFQDSVMFNLSIKENIAFNSTVKDQELQKAIETAELKNFIEELPEGLSTLVSERGTSLSGGQKQRIMLARALALNPKILLLDDFTARVDADTEHKILTNVHKNYPDMTLISVTQKISSIQDYDQIIVLMEGELLASGKHEDLLKTSPEYVQIFNSQRSTNELQA